jgi:hypothetical protein
MTSWNMTKVTSENLICLNLFIMIAGSLKLHGTFYMIQYFLLRDRWITKVVKASSYVVNKKPLYFSFGPS